VFSSYRESDLGALRDLQFFEIKVYAADYFVGELIAQDGILRMAVQGFAVERGQVRFFLFCEVNLSFLYLSLVFRVSQLNYSL
jgi:hypothetical protein